jgi:hypothetical protein
VRARVCVCVCVYASARESPHAQLLKCCVLQANVRDLWAHQDFRVHELYREVGWQRSVDDIQVHGSVSWRRIARLASSLGVASEWPEMCLQCSAFLRRWRVPELCDHTSSHGFPSTRKASSQTPYLHTCVSIAAVVMLSAAITRSRLPSLMIIIVVGSSRAATKAAAHPNVQSVTPARQALRGLSVQQMSSLKLTQSRVFRHSR